MFLKNMRIQIKKFDSKKNFVLNFLILNFIIVINNLKKMFFVHKKI